MHQKIIIPLFFMAILFSLVFELDLFTISLFYICFKKSSALAYYKPIYLLQVLLMRSHLAKPPLKQNLKLKEKSEVITNITHVSQRSRTNVASSIIKNINIDYFKVYPCQNTGNHDNLKCIYYHNQNERKRFGNFYSSSNTCESVLKKEKCPSKQECPNAHTEVQLLYHPDNYKQKFCKFYPKQIYKCKYDDYCPHAHSQQEIKSELIHHYVYDADFFMFYYKTKYCPFTFIPHDEEKCVYAHSISDYRRSPSQYFYSPVICFNVSQNNLLCQEKFECGMCHSWLEFEYHPNYYKTRICQDPFCSKIACPNYHNESEKRQIQNHCINNTFRYVSKNRVTKGIFKLCNQKDHFQARNSAVKIRSYSSIPCKKYRQKNDPQNKESGGHKTQLRTLNAEPNGKEPAKNYQFLNQQQVQSQVENSSQEDQMPETQVNKKQ